MKYYPLSQLTTNLYTKGNEYILVETKEIYKGYYFKTSNGLIFSGKSPQDKPNRKLQKINIEEVDDLETEGIRSKQTFWTIGNPSYRFSQSTSPILPSYYYPNPTEQDYQIGEFERYFVSKVNEIEFIEVNQIEYNRYLNSDPSVSYQLYIPLKLSWVLTGKREQVYEINLKSAERIQLNFRLRGFTQYFRGRFTQFYREVGTA
jgi:hypothetical protein